MKYTIKMTSRFERDIKQAAKRGKDIEKLFAVVEKLANDELLDPKYKDHPLSGEYSDCRLCHIEPDRLLIYENLTSF